MDGQRRIEQVDALVRQKPINLQHEPDYRLHKTVLFALSSPDMTAHKLSDDCKIEEPHLIDACGTFGEPFTQLYEGDGLEILPESIEFNFKCCGCGLIHNIQIENKGRNIILRFYEK